MFSVLSLLRFRTALKDAKDMGYMFLVMAVGMGIGTHNYLIAVFTTLIVLLLVIVLTKINFGSIRKFDYILSFSLDTRKTQEKIYKMIFDKYLKTSHLLNIKAKEQGHILILSFNIKFISDGDAPQFTADLEAIEGISEVTLITAKNDIEY